MTRIVIIPATLKRLQEAFLVYESQVDTDWNTGWFDFKMEWQEIELQQNMVNAISEMLLRFFDAIIFASLDQIKSWSELKLKTIQSAIDLLIERDEIVKMEISDLGEGFMRKKDLYLNDEAIIPSVFMLDKSDFLVRVYLNELKQLFSGKEVLQYLLIDGEFKGAVLGHWRIGPHDIEDIELHLVQDEAEKRKKEITAAIREIYSIDTTAILRFNGEALV